MTIKIWGDLSSIAIKTEETGRINLEVGSQRKGKPVFCNELDEFDIALSDVVADPSLLRLYHHMPNVL